MFQVGANNGDTLTVTTTAVTTVAGGLTTAAAASTALAALDAKLDTITTNRASYGAAMSRFGMAISNLQITGENQSAARARIMDADFAAETANLSRAQILQQAGSAMVAQANQLPQLVLDPPALTFATRSRVVLRAALRGGFFIGGPDLAIANGLSSHDGAARAVEK